VLPGPDAAQQQSFPITELPLRERDSFRDKKSSRVARFEIPYKPDIFNVGQHLIRINYRWHPSWAHAAFRIYSSARMEPFTYECRSAAAKPERNAR